MNTIIEMHESIIGEFAGRGDAEAVGLALLEMGWPVMYSEGGAPRWKFASLAEFRRFQIDFEEVRDNLSRAGSLRVSWGCDCDERHTVVCPHGKDPRAVLEQQPQPPLEELWGWVLREAMEKQYPGLARWIENMVDCLYGALAFGHRLEEKTGVASAMGLWLRREWSQRNGGGLCTYDQHIGEFARFVDFASHDAWFSQWLAKDKVKLDDLQQCPVCGDLIGFGCRCEEEE